jgi:cell volume regulation protein A
MPELANFSLIILIVSCGFVVAILSTKLGDVVPIPGPVIFLVAAAIVSDVWPDVGAKVPPHTVARIATVALLVILLNGGIDIGWQRMRSSLGPVLSLGVLGTFLTAAVIALAAHALLGLDWTLAGIVGAALSPTDPAVVFSVLGRREIEGRAGTTLEGEAGVNDPAAIALMLGMIELATHHDASFLVVVEDFVVEMGVGTAVGLAAGRLLVPLLFRVRLPSEGLYPVLVLVVSGALYAATSLIGGSGFLAVFVAGMFLGDAATPFKSEIIRFQSALASLAEIVVFVALGLTIHLGGLSAQTWLHGAILTLVIAVIARPLTVALTLGAAQLSRGEKAFIAWSGLKGAVPILLAAFAIIGGVDGARSVYGLVFVVVLLSVLGQGTLVPLVARSLGVPMRERPLLPWRLSVSLAHEPDNALDFTVAASSAAAGHTIGELTGLDASTWVRIIVRDGQVLRPDDGLRLRAGDHVHLMAEESEAPRLAELFD